MKIKTFVFFTFLFASVLVVHSENCLTSSTLLPTEEISSQKTLVDPNEIKEYVMENFAFTDPAEITILSEGVNDIYLVEAGTEKYVLRLSRADKKLTLTDNSFLFELEWLEFLNNHQVPVSYPLRRMDKQLFGFIETWEGPRYTTLFSYAEGTTDLNEEQAFILGRSVALLHIVSEDFKTDLERDHLDIAQLIDQPKNQIKMIYQHRDKELHILDKLTDKLRQQISNMNKATETYGIISGDMHGYNQHFTQDNHLTMFDFEFCAYGYRVYDIATFKWGRGSDNTELWNAFLNGYQSIRKLDDSEMNGIETFVQARQLWWISAISKILILDDEFWQSAFSEFEAYLLD